MVISCSLSYYTIVLYERSAAGSFTSTVTKLVYPILLISLNVTSDSAHKEKKLPFNLVNLHPTVLTFELLDIPSAPRNL